MEDSTVVYTYTYGLEKVKRSIHQLELHSQLAERRENRDGETVGERATLERGGFLWGRENVPRYSGMRPAPRIPRRHSPAQGEL